jgi:hypothetical protein
MPWYRSPHADDTAFPGPAVPSSYRLPRRRRRRGAVRSSGVGRRFLVTATCCKSRRHIRRLGGRRSPAAYSHSVDTAAAKPRRRRRGDGQRSCENTNNTLRLCTSCRRPGPPSVHRLSVHALPLLTPYSASCLLPRHSLLRLLPVRPGNTFALCRPRPPLLAHRTGNQRSLAM